MFQRFLFYGCLFVAFAGTCRTSFHPICAREASHKMEVWGRYGCDNVCFLIFFLKYGIFSLLLIISDFVLILRLCYHKCSVILYVSSD